MLLPLTVLILCFFNALFASSDVLPKRRIRGMSEALERAVERTKEWQSTDRDRRDRPIFTQSAAKAKANRPFRMGEMDVQRLNRMLKVVDRSWTLPKLGSEEPIGSNFQYKKTCASIYKARHNACEQAGFGIMCFNFCYEKGEKLAFKCEDASAPSFCRNNGNYDNFLNKYRKDTYRAKAYIHQQLTRCYASAICEGALLNSTLLPKTVKQHTHEARAFRKGQQWQRKESRQRMFRGSKNGGRGRNGGGEMRVSEETTTTQVPFWQKLLLRKKMEEKGGRIGAGKGKEGYNGGGGSEDDYNNEGEGSEREEEEGRLERQFGRRGKNREDEHIEREEEEGKREEREFEGRGKNKEGDQMEREEEKKNEDRSEGRLRRKGEGQAKRTGPPYWERPLERVPSSHTLNQLTPGKTEHFRPTKPNNGFWRNFQPGKWFQTVHYMTNTG